MLNLFYLMGGHDNRARAIEVVMQQRIVKLLSIQDVESQRRLVEYQQLVDEKLIESRRGLGMFVNAGARDLLLQAERQKFLAEEWPRISASIQRLGLTPEDLLRAAKGVKKNDGD